MSPNKITDHQRRDKTLDAVELRRRAEARLRESKKGEADCPGTEQDTQRLLHELQVHQIELEMQNEQLQQDRHEVESVVTQYTDLYGFAPVGYFTLASDGTIRQANLTGAHLLSVERSRLVNRRFGFSFPTSPTAPSTPSWKNHLKAGQARPAS